MGATLPFHSCIFQACQGRGFDSRVGHSCFGKKITNNFTFWATQGLLCWMYEEGNEQKHKKIVQVTSCSILDLDSKLFETRLDWNSIFNPSGEISISASAPVWLCHRCWVIVGDR